MIAAALARRSRHVGGADQVAIGVVEFQQQLDRAAMLGGLDRGFVDIARVGQHPVGPGVHHRPGRRRAGHVHPHAVIAAARPVGAQIDAALRVGDVPRRQVPALQAALEAGVEHIIVAGPVDGLRQDREDAVAGLRTRLNLGAPALGHDPDVLERRAVPGEVETAEEALQAAVEVGGGPLVQAQFADPLKGDDPGVGQGLVFQGADDLVDGRLVGVVGR